MPKISAYPDGGAVQLTDQFVVARAGHNKSILGSNVGGSGGGDGWTAITATATYVSADAPSYVVNFNADMTAILGLGDKIKVTHGGVTKYFIVTAVAAFAAGVTPVTLYGGTLYTLAATAITNPYYSHAKTPFGFPIAESNWTQEFVATSDFSQATPTINVWYNAYSLSVPIGLWRLKYEGVIGSISNASQTATRCQGTLSTANNTESDVKFSSFVGINGAAGTLVALSYAAKSRIISLAAKTTYYFNMRTILATEASITTAYISAPIIISAICAYL